MRWLFDGCYRELIHYWMQLLHLHYNPYFLWVHMVQWGPLVLWVHLLQQLLGDRQVLEVQWVREDQQFRVLPLLQWDLQVLGVQHILEVLLLPEVRGIRQLQLVLSVHKLPFLLDLQKVQKVPLGRKGPYRQLREGLEVLGHRLVQRVR